MLKMQKQHSYDKAMHELQVRKDNVVLETNVQTQNHIVDPKEAMEKMRATSVLYEANNKAIAQFEKANPNKAD
jgi:hypothetical protein